MTKHFPGINLSNWIRASLFGVLLSASGYAAALPSFPGAVGFGTDTPGGRGGQVIEVTNLNEEGPGSLRAALEDATGPRIVVFRTGGIIKLTRVIQVTHPYVTIAGQTAPGDGITLRGAAIRIATHDVIIRGIHIRAGDDPGGPSPDNRDAMQVEGHFYNVVIDHCSFSWAIDETLTFYGIGSGGKSMGNHDATLSNNILSEALMNSLHSKGGHSKGSLAGPATDRISYIGNLFASMDERNPKIRATNAVVVNNVTYNRHFKDLDIEFSTPTDPQKITAEGNVFLKGPDAGSPRSIYIRDGLTPGTKIYLKDNDCSSYGVDDCVQIENPTAPNQANALVGTRPIWIDGLVALPSSETLASVLANAGPSPTHRDPVDARVIEDVKNRTGRIIDSPSQVGGWPVLDPGAAPLDSDHDGMPDDWESAHGLDSSDPADGAKDGNGDGYTNVEEYINSFFSPQAAVAGDPPAAPGNFKVF